MLQKSKIILLIFLAGFTISYFPIQANAELAPEIFVQSVEIDSINGNEIKGKFTVWNSEKYYLSDLNYKIELFQGTDFAKLQLINLKISEETFFVAPNKKITKSFIYQYPKNIADGDYTVRAQIMTSRGSELGWRDQIVSLKGENKFLEMLSDSPRVLTAGQEFFPAEGVNVDPKQKVTASFKAKNPGKEITATPNIKIFQRQTNMPVVKEYQDSPITFNKGETKEIKLDMPALENPESYLAEIKFFNGEEQISGIRYFRWVVKGTGGKILYVKADKDYYKAGEDINLTIESIGPADAKDIGNGELKIAVYDKNEKLIAETSQYVLLNSSPFSSVISIPVKNDLVSPKINVKLTKDGKNLDERTINLPIFSEEAKKIEKEREFIKYLIYISVAVALLTMILIFIFLFLKFRRPNNPTENSFKI